MTRSRSMPMAAAAATTNGCGPVTVSSTVSASSSTPSGAVTVQAISESATAGYMTIASTSTIVAMVSRCMVARCCAIGTTSTVCARPRANTRRASRSAPPGVVRSPTPTATTPAASSRTSPPSRCSRPRAVELLDAGEARVVGVDGGGDRALAVPGGHGQRGHGHLVADPDRGVAGEQQVRQRRDDEVAAVHHLVGQALAAAQLVVGEAGDERGRRGPRGRARPGAWSPRAAGWRRAAGRRRRRRSARPARTGRTGSRSAAGRRSSTSTPRVGQRLRRTRRAPPARGPPTGRRRRATGRCCAA